MAREWPERSIPGDEPGSTSTPWGGVGGRSGEEYSVVLISMMSCCVPMKFNIVKIGEVLFSSDGG